MNSFEARRTSIRKKQKEMHVPAMSLEKTAFDMSGIEPWTFWSRVSDVPTRAICSPASGRPGHYIYNIATPASGFNIATPASGYKFCTWQFTFKLI